MAPLEKPFTTRCALAALVLLALAPPPPAARSAGHCAAAAQITPIPGETSAFRIRTPAGSTAARWPAARPETIVPAFVIRAMEHGWDANGNTGDGADTLTVPAGSTIRWQLVSGIHTLTSGRGADDPDAGIGFDYLLDDQHSQFDSTFTVPDTVPYFCFFHEPAMRGVLIVVSNAGVPGQPTPTRLAFTHPPRPNPSRGAISFDISLPREQKVRVEVVDLLGTRVALLNDGPLTAGEHPFRWRGLTDRGERAPSGLYTVILSSGSTRVARQVSLLR
jgi:plastocyanin